MKMILMCAVWACFCVGAVADDGAMSQAILRYEQAFNRGDVAAIGSIWAEDAVLEDESSQSKLVGREAIIGQLEQVFADDTPPTLSVSTDSVTAQDDGTILVSGVNTLTTAGANESFAFSASIESIDGKWQITQVTERLLDDASVEGSQASPLQSIDWLIGVWSALGDDAAMVNEFRYMPGGGFIVRTFKSKDDKSKAGATQGSLGYQVIGAIPGTRQLRSWTFLGDGSVGQGNWSVEEGRILIQSKGRLADGAEASGTYVLKVVDENTMTMKVVGHTISGEPVPSEGTVTLTRETTTVEPQQ